MNHAQLTPMRQFSTATFAPCERIAAWRDAYGQTIAKLEFEPVSEAAFDVEATLRSLPGLGIASMTTEGLSFSKPRALTGSDDLVVVTVDAGGYSGSQLGREVQLGPSEAVMRLDGEVASGRIFGRLGLIRVPIQAIAPMVGDISESIQRRIPAMTDALQLLRPYVRVVKDNVTPELQRLTVTHVYDLVALMFGATRDAAEVARGRGVRAARLRAIKDDISRNLAHGDVTVGAVALRHRVSPRYVQRLFEHEGITFTEYVLAERLAYIHRLLTDPHRVSEKIVSLAFDAGFNDLSHFYRAFRRRYGASPSDVRAQSRRGN